MTVDYVWSLFPNPPRILEQLAGSVQDTGTERKNYTLGKDT